MQPHMYLEQKQLNSKSRDRERGGLRYVVIEMVTNIYLDSLALARKMCKLLKTAQAVFTSET